MFFKRFLEAIEDLTNVCVCAFRYSVFRRVVNYYQDDPTGMSDQGEDAFDMRKPCSRDKDLIHVREDGENFLVNPEDVY